MFYSLRLSSVVWRSCRAVGISLKFPPLSNPQGYLRLFIVSNFWKWSRSSICITWKGSLSGTLRWEACLKLFWM
jgi:hypothetical protein